MSACGLPAAALTPAWKLDALTGSGARKGTLSTVQDSVRALRSLNIPPITLWTPPRSPGPGKEARRKLRTLAHRCPMMQQMRHATPDPVRNHVWHIESHIAFPIPAQGPGSCGTESRTYLRTISGIGRIPQRVPHAPPYLEGTSRTVPNPCRVQQWIPHAMLDPSWLGPVGNASIPYDLERRDRVACRSQRPNNRKISRGLSGSSPVASRYKQ